MNKKLENLAKVLSDMESVLIAYSGGVDSTFLLKVAADTLGNPKIIAVTAASPTFPSREMEDAQKIAKQLNIKQLIIKTKELDNPKFVHNDEHRCYWCKKELFSRLCVMAKAEGLKFVADGTNFDDQKDFRPGRRAAKELGIRSPLKETGFTKQDIRRFSRELNLPTWNKPSFACLASRFPYGTKLTLENLIKLDKAEIFLRNLGFTQVRVRHHDKIARIEVLPQEMPKILGGKLSKKIADYFQDLGYTYTTIDLQGYISGSMNRVRNSQKGEQR